MGQNTTPKRQHKSVTEVRTKQEKQQMYVAVDRTCKFAYAQFYNTKTSQNSVKFLKELMILLFLFLIHLFYSFPALSGPINSNRMQKCWSAFSNKTAKIDSFVEKIRKSSYIQETWDSIPNEMKTDVAKKILTEKKDKDKLLLEVAQVTVKSLQNHLQNSKLNKSVTHDKISQTFKLLYDHVIFHFSKRESRLKNKNNEYIKEKVKDTKNKIYTLFKDHPKYITPKLLRSLAEGIKLPKNYSKEDRIFRIRILKKFSKEKDLKDTLTIQRLGEGLSDFEFEVRKETAEALGQILSKKMGFFDRTILNIVTKKPNNYLISILLLTGTSLSYPHLDVFFTLPVIGLSIAVLFSYALSDPTQTRDIIWHISEKLSKASFDPKDEVRKSAIQSISQMKVIYPFLIDALVEAIAFSENDEIKKQALKSLKDNLSAPFYYLSGRYYEERKEQNVLNYILKPIYERYDNKHEYRRIILDFLEKKKIAPKKYYSTQDEKAKELKKELKDYQEKNIKTIRKDSNNNEPPPFDSWFEIEVFLRLHEKGYIIVPQFPVPKEDDSNSFYYIDLVILDSKNPEKRLALECDGPDHRDITAQEKDIERQKKLEQRKWPFWRIRYNDSIEYNSVWEQNDSSILWIDEPPFYNKYPSWKKREINPNALDSLLIELEERGITPVKLD